MANTNKNAVNIYVNTILSPDETTSSTNINNLVNTIQKNLSENPIKIPVSVDSASYTKQANAVAKSINTAVQKALSSVNTPEINFKATGLDEFKTVLQGVGVSDSAIANLNSQLAEMGLTVSNVRANWESVTQEMDGATYSEQKFVNAVITAKDELGNTVTQVARIAENENTVEITSTSIVHNYEQLNKEAEKAAAAEEKATAQRQKWLTQQEEILENYHEIYTAATAGTDNDIQAAAMEEQYKEASAAITKAQGETGELDDATKRYISDTVSGLKSMIDLYNEINYVNGKDIDTVKSEQLVKLDEYQDDLRNAGLLTDDWKAELDGVRTALNTSLDSTQITEYLKSFTNLKNSINSFKSDVELLKGYYSDLAKLNTQLTTEEIKLTGMTYGTEEYKQQEAIISRISSEISGVNAKIEASGVATEAVTAAAKQAANYEQTIANNADKLALAQAKVSDKVAEMNNYLSTAGTTVEGVVEKFSGLPGKTDSLETDVKELTTLWTKMNDLESYSSVDEKLADYERLKTLLTSVQSQVEKLASAEEKANAQRQKWLAQQETTLSKSYASYAGDNATYKITDTSQLSDLQAKYDEVYRLINEAKQATGEFGAETQTAILKAQAELDSLIDKYQEMDYVATTLRTKEVEVVKNEQLNKLEQYEKSLRNAGLLTDEWESEIATLRTQLSGATESKQITSYLDQLDTLKSRINSFKADVQLITEYYNEFASLHSKLATEEVKLTGMTEGTEEYKQQLVVIENIKTQLGETLQKISASGVATHEVVAAAQEASGVAQTVAANVDKVNVAEAKAADNAADMDQEFKSIGSTIENLRTKYNDLTVKTDSLNSNFEQMNTLFKSLSSSENHTTEQWKADFQKLQDLIPQVRSEIVTLNNTANTDLRAEKFVTDLEKAKASLQTVAKNWSALFQNADLTSSYNKLASELNNIENPQQLKLWNAELNTFKAQVKAAGANTMTFTDQVKKNIEAFTSWFSAIQVFYSVVRTLKSAIETVIDLDTAMVDLKKTTDATTEEYQEFYAAANDTAKALGVTTEEVISMTAEWSRLGYTLEEAADLAEISSIFASISPDMDTDTAVEGLVSILKAFDQFDDIDTEDVLDAIVSKVNAVGNSFALSNDDVVTALENSSAAMNAANNSFEETVAIATAAIEVTQDASTVGNALKTVSMRIRGYDEDTEEFDEDIYELTGDIADLTKVASNGFTGVSLFTDSTKETYRSTYEILEDIANIWDELSDTNQAELLQVLFGKTRAQVGASILSNFESASEALQVMEDSAGGAEAEMEIIYESIEYQLNALQETWTGVAQSLFQSDDISYVITWLQTLSDAAVAAIDNLGLFGSVGVVGFTAGIAKIVSTGRNAVSTIKDVTNSLSGIKFDTNSISTFIDAFDRLTDSQKSVVAANLSLDDSQVSLINTFSKFTAVTEDMTYETLEMALGLADGTLASKANAQATDTVTTAKLKALVASGDLTQAQMEEIVSTYSVTAANEAAGDSYVTLGDKIKTSIAAITASPAAMASVVVSVISAVITVVSLVKSYTDEAKESAEDLISAYEDAEAEVEELSSELEENQSRIDELNAMDSLTVIEQQELDKLEETNKKLETQLELRQLIAEQTEKEKNEAIEDEYEDTTYKNEYRMGSQTDTLTYMKDSVAAYQTLLAKKNQGIELTAKEETAMDNAYSNITTLLENMLDLQEEYTGEALQDEFQQIVDIGNAAINTESYIESAIGELPEWFQTYLSNYANATGLTEDEITRLADALPAFSDILDEAGYSAEDMAYYLNNLLYVEEEIAEETASVFSGTLTDLSELTDEVSGGLDILEAAKEEMESEGHISVDTIADLAGYDEDNYLEYLYEEEGQLKLNTEAFQEYVQAKMLDEITDYQEELDQLKEEKKALADEIIALKRSSDAYKDGGAALAEMQEEQKANNEAIEEAEKTLAIYQAAYDSLTETVEESTNAFKTVEDYTTYLSDLWDSEDLDDIKEDIEDIIDATGELNANDVEDLCDSSEELAKMLELDGMNAEFLAEVLEQLSEGNDGLALITEEALALNEALDGMESQFSTVTEAIEKYNSALEASEKDEDFQTYSEAYTTMIESFESGQINSNAFWASAELLFGTDQLKEWEWSADIIYEKLQNLENAFSDDESAGAGFLQTLYEMAEAGELVDEAGNALLEISKSGTGEYSFSIDYENIDDIAVKMGISEDAAIACLKALSMWGEVDFYNVEEVLQVINDIGLSSDFGESQVINIEALEEQLENLGKTSKEIYDIEQALEALDNVVLLNITGETSDLVASLKSIGLATDNDESLTVDVDYAALADLLKELEYTQEQAEDTFKVLSELNEISLTDSSGELITLSDALEYIKEINTDEATTAVEATEEAVEETNDSVETLDEQTLDNVTGEFETLYEEVVDANGVVIKLYKNIKKIDGMEVDATVNVTTETSDSSGTGVTDYLANNSSYESSNDVLGIEAAGTTHATAGPALTGEEGPELVQSDGYAYLVGTDGPEIANLSEGDVVYTAEETKAIFKSGKGIHGVIPSFEGGTDGGASSRGLSLTENKTGYSGDTEYGTVTVEVDADASDAEDELEDLCEELQDALDEILDDYEHNIFMLEKANAPVEEIVAIYKAMQEQVHAYAEQYRALGLDENDDYIQELQEQWWEYEEEIRDAIAEAYEDARSEMENYISLRENWLSNIEYLDANDSDAAIFNVESVSDYENISKNIIAEYRELQENLHEEAEYYRSLGYSETSDEISDLSDAWWDYEEEIREVSENINDYLESIVDTASEMLDDISNAYDTLHDAADAYAETGYITVDTLQSIIELGPEYMQYLTDENGLLVINEESINKVIAAMTEQLALEQALTYIERLHLAATGESSESLDELCYNTQETTDSTWGLVYAELALMKQLGELTDAQYEAALHNVEMLEELANATVDSIGTTTSSYSDELEEMQDGLDDIIKYVMDMLEDRINDQIDALEDLKDAYSDLIELRKEALEAAEDEADYEEEVADLVQEIADIEAQISLLSLDDSREAAAERAELEEELAELQEELADTQADYALDAQIDALDDMEEAYEEEKDAEIATLEETISSYEKLYQMAIAYIEENWDTLYDELLEWNYEQGDVLNETIIEAWNAAYAAAVKYGDYVSALAGVEEDIESTTSGTSLTVASTSGTTTTSTAEDNVITIVKWMQELSTQWASSSESQRESLHAQAVYLASLLTQYGVTAAYDSSAGTWTITSDSLNSSNVGKLLYEAYGSYHTGGIVGADGLKEDEELAILKYNEWVLTEDMVENLKSQMANIEALADAFSGSTISTGTMIPDTLLTGSTENVTNNSQPVEITIGDTVIQGSADSSTVAQHIEVTRDMVDQIARILKLKL